MLYQKVISRKDFTSSSNPGFFKESRLLARHWAGDAIILGVLYILWIATAIDALTGLRLIKHLEYTLCSRAGKAADFKDALKENLIKNRAMFSEQLTMADFDVYLWEFYEKHWYTTLWDEVRSIETGKSANFCELEEMAAKYEPRELRPSKRKST